MMKRAIHCLLLVAVGLSVPAPAYAQRAKYDVSAEEVNKAIERGKKYLYDIGKQNGDWEAKGGAMQQRGGVTALALLALLTAGVPTDDPVIKQGLDFLRAIPPEQTYVVGLQTMVFAQAGHAQDLDKQRIQRNVNWMMEAAATSGGKLIGWGYNKVGGGTVNASNSQYVLLGLHAGLEAKAHVDPGFLKAVRELYETSQEPDGGYSYIPFRDHSPRLTMSTAGLCGLLITGMDVVTAKELTGGECGRYDQNRYVVKALDYLNKNLPRPDDYAMVPNLYYCLYGIERAGRLSGLRYLGNRDWYREGCWYLVRMQSNDGSWAGRPPLDSSPVVASCFAVMFLSKGRSPVLISKLAHDGRGAGGLRYRREMTADGTFSPDWNNDRNDVRHLTAFASDELFKGIPLAWQVFDAKQAGDAGAGQEATPEDLARELLQSPIAYLNGHHAPYFEDREILMLRKYLEEGGFLFAEACCGKTEFKDGFAELMREVLPGPEFELKELPATHPIYTASGKFVSDAEKFPLWGIDRGCKTIVVFSPTDLSCRWEANKTDKPIGNKKGPGQLAFEMGANMVAYATGLEPPLPRLHKVEITTDAAKKPAQGYVKVAQVRYAVQGWQPARQAMPSLMRAMVDRGVTVSIKTEELGFNDANLVDFKLLYMHGRRAFDPPSEAARKTLRFNLEKAGGLLFADACCGAKEFDASFRKFIREVFPDKELQPISVKDDLYSEELNGKAVSKVRCRTQKPEGNSPGAGYQAVEPMLEGIKVDGRWVVIYSKYDIGCALEKHQSPDCIGYDHASAVDLGSAIVMYALKR